MFETQTQSEKDWLRAQIAQIGDIGFFVNSIIAAVMFALLFVTGNTMMQSVRERVPELAVLKTYGFSNTAVVSLVIAESLLLCSRCGRHRHRHCGPVIAADLSRVRRGRAEPAAVRRGAGRRFCGGVRGRQRVAARCARAALSIVDALAGR